MLWAHLKIVLSLATPLCTIAYANFNTHETSKPLREPCSNR